MTRCNRGLRGGLRARAQRRGPARARRGQVCAAETAHVGAAPLAARRGQGGPPGAPQAGVAVHRELRALSRGRGPQLRAPRPAVTMQPQGPRRAPAASTARSRLAVPPWPAGPLSPFCVHDPPPAAARVKRHGTPRALHNLRQTQQRRRKSRVARRALARPPARAAAPAESLGAARAPARPPACAAAWA